jgi:hypothetical protein
VKVFCAAAEAPMTARRAVEARRGAAPSDSTKNVRSWVANSSLPLAVVFRRNGQRAKIAVLLTMLVGVL